MFINMDSFETYLNKAQKSLFRFEGLQDYGAEDDKSEIRFFIKTGTVQTHPADVEWCRQIKQKNERGITTARVRLVLTPLTEYTKWELAWHKEVSAFSGDDIRVIETADLPDFWIIDDSIVLILKYGPRGKFLGFELIDEAENIAPYIEYKNFLMKNSVPVSQYLDSHK